MEKIFNNVNNLDNITSKNPEFLHKFIFFKTHIKNSYMNIITIINTNINMNIITTINKIQTQ